MTCYGNIINKPCDELPNIKLIDKLIYIQKDNFISKNCNFNQYELNGLTDVNNKFGYIYYNYKIRSGKFEFSVKLDKISSFKIGFVQSQYIDNLKPTHIQGLSHNGDVSNSSSKFTVKDEDILSFTIDTSDNKLTITNIDNNEVSTNINYNIKKSLYFVI